MTSKHLWRQTLLSQRRTLSPDTLGAWSLSLCTRLTAFPPLGKASCIAAYSPLPGELSTLSLLKALPHATFVFPRCEAKTLCFAPATQNPSLWRAGPMGLQEPVAPAVDTSAIDWMLIPALACDSFGTRLGYGAGYYDRFLATAPLSLRRHTIGIITPNALIERLPRDPWDIPLAFIATPHALLPIQNP